MLKYAAMAAAAVSALLATSAFAAEPAAPVLKVSSPADPMVRITITGKSSDQLAAEFKAAAESVCGVPSDQDADCVKVAIEDANRQLSAINARQNTPVASAQVASNVQVTRDDKTEVRISLTGKSAAQIDQDIQDAAQTVCKASGYAGGDLTACVNASVSVAKLQLRTIIAQTNLPSQLASR